MDQNSVFEMFQSFIEASEIRTKIKIPLDEQLQNQINLMEYLIRCAFQKGAKVLYKHRKPKKFSQSLKAFERAFKEFNQVQKLIFYNKTIQFLDELINQNFKPPQINLSGELQCKVYIKGSIGWKQAILKLNSQKKLLCIEKQGKLRVYDLQNYILRNSKTSDYNSLVLQGISDKLHAKSLQVHLGFKDIKLFRQWHKYLKNCLQFVMWQKIKKKLYPIQLISLINQRNEQVLNRNQNIKNELDDIKMSYSTIIPSKKEQKKQNITRSQSKRYSIKQNDEMEQSQCQSVQLKSSNSQLFFNLKTQQQNNQYQNQLKQEVFGELLQDDILKNQNQNSQFKIKKDIFHKLLPQYNLSQIQKINEYEEIFANQQKTFRIFKQESSSQNFKMLLESHLSEKKEQIFSRQEVINFLANTQNFNLINSQIQQMSIKTLLNSQNSAIIYQKNKQFNKLYRSRDLVLIRHVFQFQNKIYVVDKSIQNNNIPPFTTIVRGQAQIIYQVQLIQNKIKLIVDYTMKNQGYLKDYQEVNLNLKFLKGYLNLFESLKKLNKLKINIVFSTEWTINKETQNQDNSFKQVNQDDSLQRKKSQSCQCIGQQKQCSPILLNEFKSMEKMEIEGQIQESNISNQVEKIIRQTDQKDEIIVKNNFLKYKHNLIPIPNQPYQYQFLQALNGQNPMWLGDWKFPDQGGIVFINKKKIQDQKNVLKFILSQVAKNVLSGKSIMNISLPVDIFSPQSNLQRFLYSLSYAPFVLQSIVNKTDLQRFVYSVAFGLSMSPLYLGMQKPFNPILGQTFQCYIQGCPGYAQQISHHPPIASIFFQGRGYQISGQLQAKMKLNINSGTGSNQGIYKIIFEDGYDVSYISPPGEVSGLAYGDRKFNMIQKCYAWSKKSQLFIQIIFNPNKKGFFGKQQVPIDYLEGKVLKVKQQFLQKLTKNKQQTPKKNQILQQLGIFNGNWNKKLCYQNKTLLNFDQNYPIQLKYQNFPLPSDANWREDIHYRRILSITKAQIWKQKLQIAQRKDKKLRQSFFKNNDK